MPIESPNVTSNLMTIVMFALSIIIYEIFAVENSFGLDSPFRIDQGHILICLSKAFLFDEKNNVCHICLHLRDICDRNVYCLDLTF